MQNLQRDVQIDVATLHMSREINMTGYDLNMQTSPKSVLDMQILTVSFLGMSQMRFWICKMTPFCFWICTSILDMLISAESMCDYAPHSLCQSAS